MSVNRFAYLSILLIGSLLSQCADSEPISLNFAFGPDDTGTVARLIKDFNRSHRGEIRVNWMEGARASNEFYRQIARDLAEDESQMDVIGSDVVWTSALARNGWVKDLTGTFYDAFENEQFLTTALEANVYQAKIWGVPWYTDAGVLFYRKDLLRAAGYNRPPATWDELREMTKTVMASPGVTHGYVFQGANYEGGVANACEFIWNAGGDLLIGDLSAATEADGTSADVGVVTVNSAAAREGLAMARQLIEERVSPPEVAYFRESDATTAFADGNALFLRNWPTAYPQLIGPDSKISADQIGVAVLPRFRTDMPSYSCLGGWNLMINQQCSDEKVEAAWTFIRYLTDANQQRVMASEGGTLPSLSSLYKDEQLAKEAPIVALAGPLLEHTRARPVTPVYMTISPDLSWTFCEVLKGALNPTEAVETMQGYMEGALAVK